MLRGTVLGAALFSAPPQRQVRLEDQFDAELYLGLPSTMTTAHLAPALCADRKYVDMRLARLALVPPPPGAPVSPADSLKDYCAHPFAATTSAAGPVTDRDPRITELVRATLRDAAQGRVDPARIAPESQARLIPFLKQIGPGLLAPAGAIESFVLVSDTNDNGKRTRRYRATFASGERVMWTVGLTSSGTIVSLDPRPE
jgi:hypothetical protein